ncbi:MAG: DUF6502 family protein, partial [Alphaproteobacteria bacterium]
PFMYFTNLLKGVFVDVAVEEFRIKGKEQTDSRISLLTGVHRKDVKRLREEHQPKFAPTPVVSLGAQLVARWTGLPEYLDEKGMPRPLPRLSHDARGPSFESLVQSVSKDIRSRAVLDEWVQLGVARVDDQDRVFLNVESFVPSKGFDEKAYFFGRNLHDHLAVGVHNILGGLPPFLERSVYCDHLTPRSVAELRAAAEELAMKALKTLNKRAMESQQKDAGNAVARERLNLGVYFFAEPHADNETARDTTGVTTASETGGRTGGSTGGRMDGAAKEDKDR